MRSLCVVAAALLAGEAAWPGMLLVKRNPLIGSVLEYRDPKLERVFHERVFPASRRSFDLTMDDEDIVVLADADAGTIARVTGSREVVDHITRDDPRAITYNAQDGVVAWLEGSDEPQLAITVYESITTSPIVTQRASLGVDGCTKATHAASFRPPVGDRWFIFFVCDGRLHVVDLEFPLPTKTEPHRQLQATSTIVPHTTALDDTTAIAAGVNGTLLVAISNGYNVCSIARFHLDLHTKNIKNEILQSEEIIYDCSLDGSLKRLTGVATDGDWAYIAQVSSSVNHFKTFIGRFRLDDHFKTPNDVEIIINRANPLLAQSDLFSPMQIRVKSHFEQVTVYWLNYFDGRLRRYSFVVEDNGFRPLQSVLAEPSRGVSCPLAAVMINPQEGEAPMIVFSDHGRNAITQYQPALTAHGRILKEGTANDKVLAYTASAPSDLLYVDESRCLFWIEAERETVVVYNMDTNLIIANLTYRLDPEPIRTQLASLAYLPKTGRIYASDKADAHPRILSWKAPKSSEQGFLGGGASVVWYGGAGWSPEAIVGDPHSNVIYASSTVDATIRAIFLTPRFRNVQGIPGGRDFYTNRNRLIIKNLPTLSPTEQQQLKVAIDKSAEDVEAKDIEILEKFLELRKHNWQVKRPIGYSPRDQERGSPETGDNLPALHRSLLQPQQIGPVVRIFYRKENAAPVKHMWFNDGYLHWLQLRQRSETATEITVLYKEVLNTNNPTLPIDESQVFELATTKTDVFVSYAAFFEVRESLVPRTPREWALVLSVAGAMTVSGLLIWAILQRRRGKVYGHLSEASEYNGLSPPVERYSDRPMQEIFAFQ